MVKRCRDDLEAMVKRWSNGQAIWSLGCSSVVKFDLEGWSSVVKRGQMAMVKRWSNLTVRMTFRLTTLDLRFYVFKIIGLTMVNFSLDHGQLLAQVNAGMDSLALPARRHDERLPVRARPLLQ